MLHLRPVPDESVAFLGADDIAARLQISKATVFRWARAGRIPQPAKVGGTVRWRAADIEAWLESLRPRQKAG